jgi:hypothetical protein
VTFLKRLLAILLDCHGIILAFKPPIGGQESYWFGKTEGVEQKFIRVVLGAVLPIYDRQFAAGVVIGEVYRVTAPPTWEVLDATCKEWSKVENDMAQFRRDAKFDHVIVDREEARQLIWRMPGLQHGMDRIPMTSYAAPKYAETEVGRTVVDQLIKEKRLIIPSNFQRELEQDPNIGGMALRVAVCWLKDNLAIYQPLKKQIYGTGRILGLEGL